MFGLWGKYWAVTGWNMDHTVNSWQSQDPWALRQHITHTHTLNISHSTWHIKQVTHTRINTHFSNSYTHRHTKQNEPRVTQHSVKAYTSMHTMWRMYLCTYLYCKEHSCNFYFCLFFGLSVTAMFPVQHLFLSGLKGKNVPGFNTISFLYQLVLYFGGDIQPLSKQIWLRGVMDIAEPVSSDPRIPRVKIGLHNSDSAVSLKTTEF